MTRWAKLLRTTTLLFLVVAVGMSAVLFRVKYAVQDLEAQLFNLQSQIAGEHRAIHVLEAEWSYLTEPERLRRLARKHLDLVPLAPRQVGSFAVLRAPREQADIPQGGDVADWTRSPAAAAVVLGTEIVQ
jgi:cell division protein FtsL